MYVERKSNCSERIATALAIRNMKQADLCERTKIPKSAISQYIRGTFEPKQDRIYLIANALNVSEAWLMGYDVPMEKNETQKNSPSKDAPLTDGEERWLALYRKFPETSQQLFINVFEDFGKLPESKQQMALEMIRIALKEKK